MIGTWNAGQKMKISPTIESKLNENTLLKGQILTFIPRAEHWLESIHPIFFPEYTRHDNKHNEEVFHTAIELATDGAIRLLSPDDIAVLIGATLLHDFAMHLGEDGFLSLISPASKWEPIKPFDHKTWANLWDDFLTEAKRFDEYKLLNVFGDAQPVIRPPSDNPLDWTERDKRLIGEFLRIHHTRLAHQMALHGIPGSEATPYKIFPDGFPKHLADLSGLIARSHGVELRSCLDYLKEKYDVRDFNRVHAVFLLVLLRIADYLQIQPERAPRSTLELHKLKSPLSQQEWRVHASVQNITNTNMDPEAIQIDAKPNDAQTFVRVRDWLRGIQYELDTSWAVLGEVYGRFQNEDLDQFQIRLRRVRSNIDDVESFRRSVNYIPRIVRFEFAGTDLLKLLIDPLYGDEKLVGVRELVQNALDAVRELDHVQKLHQGDESVRVRVSVFHDEEGKPSTIEVHDTGIGMNVEILTRYFLTAGASFRHSDTWRAAFEDKDLKSEIARSGRFGVGALAAFLLGDEIFVETRRYDEPIENGLSFTARLEDQIINVIRKKLPIGTRIQIKLSLACKKLLEAPSARQDLNWYWLPVPKVEYCFGDHAAQFQKGILPNIGETAPTGWAEIETNEFWQVNWRYRGNVDGGPPADKVPASLFCNGIPLEEQTVNAYRRGAYNSQQICIGDISVPNLIVSIIDYDGNLPIDLARTRITGDPELFRYLEYAIARDYAVGCLLSEENIDESSSNQRILKFSWMNNTYRMLHRVSSYGMDGRHKHIFLPDGILPDDRQVLRECGVLKIILIPSDQSLLEAILKRFRDEEIHDVGITLLDSQHSSAPTSLLQRLRIAYVSRGASDWTESYLPKSRVSSFIHGETLRLVGTLSNLPQWLHTEIAAHSNDGWFRAFPTRGKATLLDQIVLTELEKRKTTNPSAMFVHIDQFNPVKDEEPTALLKAWQSTVLGRIPYEAAIRAELANRFAIEKETYLRLRATYSKRT